MHANTLMPLDNCTVKRGLLYTTPTGQDPGIEMAGCTVKMGLPLKTTSAASESGTLMATTCAKKSLIGDYVHRPGMSHDALVDALGGSIVTESDGTVCYYNQKGKLHRTGGPAVTFCDGTCCWFIDGTELSEEEFSERVASSGYLMK